MCFQSSKPMKKKPQITQMWADAHAARRCRLRRPASQPLWSCQKYSLNQKATPKRLRSRSERSEDSDALRSRRLHLRYLRFFLNQFGVHHMKHNLGAKPMESNVIVTLCAVINTAINLYRLFVERKAKM